jgi:flagellar biosynthesis GTPase FlhF
MTEIISQIDKIYFYVKNKKQASFTQLSKEFKLPEEKIEQLAVILDKAGLLKLVYPTNPLLPPFLKVKENQLEANAKKIQHKQKTKSSKSIDLSNPFSTYNQLKKQRQYLLEAQEEAAQKILELKAVDEKQQKLKKEEEQIIKEKNERLKKQHKINQEIQKLMQEEKPLLKKLSKLQEQTRYRER